jgi:hypothetical protein
MFVFYEDSLKHWRQDLARLAAFVGRSKYAEEPGVIAAVEEFVDATLRHHEEQMVDTLGDPDFTLPAKALYLVLRLAHGLRSLSLDAGEEYVLGDDLQRIIDVFALACLRTDTESAELREQMAAQTHRAKALGADLVEARGRMESLDASVRDHEAEIGRLCAQVAAVQRTANALTEVLSATVESLVGRVGALSSQLIEKQAQVSSLDGALGARELEVQTLLTLCDEDARRLHELLESTSWRFTAPVRGMLRFLRGEK